MSRRLPAAVVATTVVLLLVPAAPVAAAPPQVLISELRTSGPTGPNDDFVELYNRSGVAITVAATDGSSGWAIARTDLDCGDPLVRAAVIPNGTSIPALGHYLLAYTHDSPAGGSYSLGAAALPDRSLARALRSDANVGLFTTSDASAWSAATRLDAVGFGGNTGGMCDLLREGATLPTVRGTHAEHAFARSTGTGTPRDAGDNAADFVLISTGGGLLGGIPATLGTPSPDDLGSPTTHFGHLLQGPIDAGVSAFDPPNRVRDMDPYPDPATGLTFPNGTLSIQRRITNGTGQPIDRLRFRVVRIGTENTSPGCGCNLSDLRVVDSSGVVHATGGGVVATVEGLTIERPPDQSNGGGLHIALAADLSSLPAGRLAPGASIDVQFLLAVVDRGSHEFAVNVEATTVEVP